MTNINKLLDGARSLIGIASSGKSNAINTEFYGKPTSADWCAVSVAKAFFIAGLEGLTPFYKTGDKFRYNALNAAYCPNWVRYAKEHSQWVTNGYKPGDVVLYDWNGNGSPNHIGIVEAVSADGKTLTTLEGNVSDKYARCTRPVNGTVLGAFRPKYTEDKKVTYEEFKEFAQRYRAELGTDPDPVLVPKEFAEAKNIGITDGTRPRALITREEAAVMALRAWKK